MALVSIPEASKWASKHLDRKISTSNISYLVQYGKVKRHGGARNPRINLEDLRRYYDAYTVQRQKDWKKNLGDDLNWDLSFDTLREKDTTKHVHRLHPYKGKYIPQLVEYFIDAHTDNFKKKAYFKPGDIILDPFLGSGTTIVQALEMGIHAVGIDVSEFNCMIARSKAAHHDVAKLKDAVNMMLASLDTFERDAKIQGLERELLKELAVFNAKHFPPYEFKYKVSQKKVREAPYAEAKEKQFLSRYKALLKKYGIGLNQKASRSFLDIWFVPSVRREIDHVLKTIKKEKDPKVQELLALILSRTIRSCRATTHSDLATLKEPQLTTYYCYKHKKICKPIFSIRGMLKRYALDTIKRIEDFETVRTDASFAAITGDSRTTDILKEVAKTDPAFAKEIRKEKIAGIFCSPPYVGQIDYHEQHAYAYDLLHLKRKDALEIGPLYKGQGVAARTSYVEGISAVLKNAKKYLRDNYDVFLVANDKYDLYPEIAKRSGMKIVNRFKRPVLNRTERDRNPYAEIIFHFKAA